MASFRQSVYCASLLTATILLASCAGMNTPNDASGTSAGAGAAGGGSGTGAAGAPTAKTGVTPGSAPVPVGNVTGGSEAHPTADPGVTPGAMPAK